VVLMSYLIGVVFAYQLSIQAQKFGANVFVSMASAWPSRAS